MDSASLAESILESERFADVERRLSALMIADKQADPVDTARVRRAADWRVLVHHEQVDRPDGQPYLDHTTMVAEQVFAWTSVPPSEAIIAALLHDGVEDQAEKLAELGGGVGEDVRERALDAVEKGLGAGVRRLLGALTNPDFDARVAARWPDVGDEEVRGRRHQHYLEHVTEAVRTDPWSPS